jgi:hypothetical protein
MVLELFYSMATYSVSVLLGSPKRELFEKIE